MELVKLAKESNSYDDLDKETQDRMLAGLREYRLLNSTGARQSNIAARKDSDSTMVKVAAAVRYFTPIYNLSSSNTDCCLRLVILQNGLVAIQ